MNSIFKILILSLVFFAVGCSGVKNLEKPDLAIPESYDGNSSLDSLTVADLGYWEFYGDQYLIDIIQKVLNENKRLQIAAQRVEESRLLYKVDKSKLLPELSFRLPWNHETNDYYN